MALEVFGETAAAADPSERAFDDPPLGQHLEPRHVIAADDFDGPCPAPCHGSGELRSPIVGVGKDALDERELSARAAIQNQWRTVPVLEIGRMDDDIQEEAQRVDKNVPLAALDLLARVITRWIERRPPF